MTAIGPPPSNQRGGTCPRRLTETRRLCDGCVNHKTVTDRLLASTRKRGARQPNYEILFCVAQPADPVLPLVRRLIELNPDVPARLLIGNERVSANPKLNNVVKGWLAASHPWIVMADSNVLMPPDYMRRMLTTWRADTGLVSSPAVGCAPANIWAELEC